MKTQCESCKKEITNHHHIVWDLEEDRIVCPKCYHRKEKKKRIKYAATHAIIA